MNLAHLLTNAARSFPERPAVSVGDHRLYDYTAYGALSARIAGAFRDGRIGVMEYYNLKNLQADTNMRASIGGLGGENSGGQTNRVN